MFVLFTAFCLPFRWFYLNSWLRKKVERSLSSNGSVASAYLSLTFCLSSGRESEFTASRSRSKFFNFFANFAMVQERSGRWGGRPFFYSSALELRVGPAARDKTAASGPVGYTGPTAHRTGLDGVARRAHLLVISRLRRGWAAPTEPEGWSVGCAVPTRLSQLDDSGVLEHQFFYPLSHQKEFYYLEVSNKIYL